MPAEVQRDDLLAFNCYRWYLVREVFAGFVVVQPSWASLNIFLLLFRGPPRPRPAPVAGEAENKENHHEANAMSQQPLRRGYRRPYNYRRRPRPPNAPAQDGKEVSMLLAKYGRDGVLMGWMLKTCGGFTKSIVGVVEESDGQVQSAGGWRELVSLPVPCELLWEWAAYLKWNQQWDRDCFWIVLNWGQMVTNTFEMEKNSCVFQLPQTFHLYVV